MFRRRARHLWAVRLTRVRPQGIDGYYQPYGFTQQGGSSLQIDHDFGFAHFLSTTAYRETGTTISEDGALTPNYAYTLNLPWFEEHHQLSQEFQLQSEADSKIKWTGGIYLFDADGSWNPIIAEGGLEAPYTYFTYSDQKAYSGAVFGQATKEIFPDTDLTLGARYTVERRNFHGTDTYTVNDGPQLFGGYDEEHTIFQKPTWRASLDHHFSPDLMAYVSYNTGFKSGGYNDTLVPTVKFQPETLCRLRGWDEGGLPRPSPPPRRRGLLLRLQEPAGGPLSRRGGGHLQRAGRHDLRAGYRP